MRGSLSASMLKHLIVSLILAISVTACVNGPTEDQTSFAAQPVGDPVTGATITTDQIQMVRDYFDALTTDPDPLIASEAAGLVVICDKALGGNPKDRSKAAFNYNDLLDRGLIPGI